MSVVVGKSYTFRYPIEFVTLPEYSKHRGHTVVVLYESPESEADRSDELERMYKVRCEDGWEGDAFESELCE